MMWQALMVATVGSITAAVLKGFGGTSWTFSGNGSLCRQAVTPMKPGGSVTCQAISSSFVGDGGSDLVLCTFNSSAPLSSNHPLLLRPTRGPWSSVQRMTSQATPTVARGQVCCTSHIPQLSLSMSLLSTWAACCTLWQAVLASQRASSCRSSLLLGVD